MPPEQPTIWDILGYEEDAQYGMWDEEGNEFLPDQLPGRGGEYAEGVIPEGVTEGRRGGQADMLSYLSDLLLKSQGGASSPYFEDTEGEAYPMQQQDFLESLEAMSSYYGKDFSELSQDEINEFLGNYTWQQRTRERGGRGSSTSGEKTRQLSEENIEAITPLYEMLQEGFKAVPTSESFGLGRKIGDIEKAGKRELKSAREGYIPGEILSRYGALQGKAGAQQKGEQLEQAYTEDIYGVQRGMGRDVRSTYEDFEDEWFSGVESWIGGLG
jgi:hypothetical protein